ncbi:DEAD/DEAH box helicase [Microbacterium sp. RU33B]|uniref:DEAD/DEAH box helicase n=1 Tax=Microbacterium sp. RU33B TaxID=1907390 RepID=UPI000963F519|nr:DEAD/DEAH box helicase [Microbacterium sp. RU33B]SIT84694.1 Superfamily II DNA and RNA helicase [Microbacterium sp. RU33B]
MPKSKKPAGGRAAKNFEPRYGAKTSYQDRKRRPGEASAGTTGSRSAGHRGYRPEAEDAPAKRRWTAQERAGRDESRGIRSQAQGGRGDRDDRPRRDAGGERPRSSRDERPARRESDARAPYSRDDRAPRRFDDRAPRRFDDRAPRTGDRAPRRDASERPRTNDRWTERPARKEFGDARPPRDFGDRPRRSFDERPPRSFDDRPRRDAGDRPARTERPRYDRDDRPRTERPARSFDDRPRRDAGERPARTERPRYDRDDRPRTERPARSFDDRPRRDAGERPARTERPRYDRDDRPRTDRPARSFDDRPRTDRPRRDNERPARSDWAAETKPKAHQDHVDVVHERLQAEAIQAGEVADTTFGDLGLGDNIVRELSDMGAATPFPIQAATIPAILDGKDVLARGRTGSGKTIAFGAPLVESILKSQKGQRREFGRSPKALILAPTRELALQIDRTIQPIARSVGLFTTQIYGGVPQARQVGALKKGVDIIIGTPGRIEDLEKQGKLDLSDIRITVLDEGDHMCELGFLEPVQRILRLTADGSQKLLFSATLDREVASLVDEFLVEPAVYEVAGEDQDSGTIEHRVLVIDHRDKAEILTSLVDRPGKTLVFTRTRAYAEMLAEQFDDVGIRALALHGDLNQAKRTRNLERMTSGRVDVLVATDVAARGIHVDDIDLVIQADPPDEYKTYLHRSGRTGRAGRAGTVVTLVTRQRRRRMSELLERAEIDAPFDEIRPGDDVIEEVTGRQVDPVA